MKSNYRQLTENIQNRSNPDRITIQKSFSEDLSSVRYNDVLTYIRYAMNGVEPEYTKRSREAGERVKTHLEREISEISFEYQGSVMTNTHIKGYSDIDLLTISEKFYGFDRLKINEAISSSDVRTKFFSHQVDRMVNESKKQIYTGNSLEDLKQLRKDCELTLAKKYTVCDISKPKAIKINNLDLKREVDIVVANWFDDITSVINNKGIYRGIQVYNKETGNKGTADYPFLSISRINEKSSLTTGRLKKMIRFLKNIKADSDLNINLSSFDINAICYDIDSQKYMNSTFVGLVPIIFMQLYNISTDTNYANRIVSVDEREYIFRGKPDKLENLKKLMQEVAKIYTDSTKNTLNS